MSIKIENLPKVQLETWLPEPKTIFISAATANAMMPNRENKDQPIDFHYPRVWKMSLTKNSEIEIFGDESPYRTARLPPLPWGNEQYFNKKLAVIDEEQVKIYNARIQQIYETYNPELIPEKQIIPGVVEVFRAAHDVALHNVEYKL